MDRKKVIKALECRKNADKRCGNPCEESGMCHYATAVRDINGEIYRPFICDRERICTDALALLKEQPEIVRCKDCKYYRATPGYCAYDRIWQENKGHIWGMYCKPDWFCADGERK